MGEEALVHSIKDSLWKRVVDLDYMIIIKRTYVRVGRTVYFKGQRIKKALNQDGAFVRHV